MSGTGAVTAFQSAGDENADIVIFLYRDEYYFKDESEKPGECEVILAKHRNGPTGSIDVAWVERYTQFKDKASGNIPDPVF